MGGLTLLASVCLLGLPDARDSASSKIRAKSAPLLAHDLRIGHVRRRAWMAPDSDDGWCGLALATPTGWGVSAHGHPCFRAGHETWPRLNPRPPPVVVRFAPPQAVVAVPGGTSGAIPSVVAGVVPVPSGGFRWRSGCLVRI